MAAVGARTVLEPFFLHSMAGKCFCIYRGPDARAQRPLAFVHVPAFGEEMNKARRMTALQARAFADRGVATLQVDLHGTGDSDGDFANARWEIWCHDVAAAASWLANRTGAAVGLWGLRLGAMLAAAVASSGAAPVSHLLLWQPVTSGDALLTQLLRLRLASGMLTGDAPGADTRKLRDGLLSGEPLEVGGYTLAPELARTLAGLKLANCLPRADRCTWLEVVAPALGLSRASQTVLESWRARGVDSRARTVDGEPFWSTVEIAECAPLIDQTTLAALETT